MAFRDLIRLAVIVSVLASAVALTNRISDAQRGEETELVRRAVREAAVTCYAVEGMYPDDLAYLREHYRLAYDEERYFVTYDAFASNQIPDIYVTERGAKLR